MSIGLNKNMKPPATAEGEENTVDSLESVENPPKASSSKMNIVLIAVGVCLALVLILAFKGNGKESKTVTDVTQDSPPEDASTDYNSSVLNEIDNEDSVVSDGSDSGDIYDENGDVVDSTGITPGIPDYSTSTNNTAPSTVYSESEFIKDLNGLDVSAVYNVSSIQYVLDYVSYEARRALTDDGMELYWLEADYAGKKYRVQVPFYYAKDLGTRGICKVEIEVLLLSDGGKIISYMRVVDDEYEVDEDNDYYF